MSGDIMRGVIVADKAVEKRNPRTEVSPYEEPSAEWGWHGSFPKTTRIGALFAAAAMFLMLIGNHQNRTEDIWLIIIGSVIVLALLVDLRRKRAPWRR